VTVIPEFWNFNCSRGDAAQRIPLRFLVLQSSSARSSSIETSFRRRSDGSLHFFPLPALRADLPPGALL